MLDSRFEDEDVRARLLALLDKQACSELVYRLARAIDRCDADALRSVFHADATDDHGSFTGSASDFIPWVLGVLAGMRQTQHLITNVLVDVAGDFARGESYFLAQHSVPAEGDTENFVTVAGRYLDRFERRDGEWRIAHRSAVYDWSNSASSSEIWDRAKSSVQSFGKRGQADASYAHFAQLTTVASVSNL